MRGADLRRGRGDGGGGYVGKHFCCLGYERCLRQTLGWLKKLHASRRRTLRLRECERKSVFSFFFASGRTLDTEELCLMTSRSPRYYVSAAYWDR